MEHLSELFGSDLTLIGAALGALALTSLGIIRDLDPVHVRLETTADLGL